MLVNVLSIEVRYQNATLVLYMVDSCLLLACVDGLISLTTGLIIE